jgi:aryl-alcohol dehydrogenase
MKIQAAVMERTDGIVAKHQGRIEDAELEGPRADEVLVRVTSCGVCGHTPR